MPGFVIAIIVVMVIAVILAIATYAADDGSGYCGKTWGMLGAAVLLGIGVIISIVIVLTKLFL